MPRKLVLLTYTVNPEDVAAYDDWIRAYDYPAFRQNPHVLEYSCFRIKQSIQGVEGFTYFDLVFHDADDYTAQVRKDPVIEQHARGYHERWFATPGTHNTRLSDAEEIWG